MATTTQQLLTLLTIMIIMNVSLHLFQEGITEAGTETSFFNTSNSPYSYYVQNNALIVDESILPSEDSQSTDTSGNIFTDTWNSFKSWTTSGLNSLKFVGSILKQPYGFLKDIGIPLEICLAVAIIWYLMALLLIVAWWGGR